eukprot:Protomagalhaensia_sp_Gyna_25__5070@NODE_575_length_3074_cov_214_350577_g445_i0_p1_GENE_NODE_575_length_3074_cov_214_350577_g445_i0NODE_575_length_3074_cov_214_350577_g445_i0_p1_ORF_typecomplete_len473_score54_94UPF0020/PF01170_18/7_7e03UPF0020/PF01170_18/1_2e22N6_N4_Mtase/PF01555_18/0_00093N6_N4_Mtase/PF01555_18/0_02N6_Mtase/PF02384_16/4_8e09MTS/PF05175_14/0_081MTS/PF05175_14/0_016Methyltransf_15/PF09445_10/0_071Methyltransf_15/PF09445_10/55Cons_hypoth95/PF03602_15/1_2Cons_hypoth95/PF03602_15/4_
MKYTLWLSIHNHYANFTYSEIEGILSSFNLTNRDIWGLHNQPRPSRANHHHDRSHSTSGGDQSYEDSITRDGDTDKLIFINLHPQHEEALKYLAQESVSVRCVARLLARGNTEDQMVQDALDNLDKEQFRSTIRDHGNTFAFFCDTHNRSVTIEDNVRRMNRLSFLFTKKEKANLKNPGVELVLLDDYKGLSPFESSPWQCQASVLGITLARKTPNSPSWRRFDLPSRPVLGPTSLDNELAVMLTHIAGCTEKVVLDPFCGTGGILISSSHRKNHCLGSDLDSRVLRGWGVAQVNQAVRDESPSTTEGGIKSNIFHNFEHYELEKPEIVRADASNSPWVNRPFVDAIVTDPPYGIRAMARQAGKTGTMDSTVTRNVDRIIEDLISLGDRVLVPNGKLVFLLPVHHDTRFQQLQSVMSFAVEKRFKTLYCPCYQPLNGGMGRYGLSLVKLL